MGFVSGHVTRSVQHHRELRALVTGEIGATRTTLLARALSRSLSLSARQRDTAQRLLHEQEPAFRAAVEPCRPQVALLRDAWLDALRAELTTGQRTRLDALLEQRRTLPSSENDTP
jgi:hypothetical protein